MKESFNLAAKYMKRRPSELVLFENAFAEIEPGLDMLVGKLQEGIREGRWSSVVGDDVSGRLPALLVGSVMSRYAKDNDLQPPNRLFIAGGRDQIVRREKLRKYVKYIKPKLGDRALIVTEYVGTGRSVANLAMILKENDVKCDVASPRMSSELKSELFQGELRQVELIGLRKREVVPSLYLHKKATGVTKAPREAVTRRPIKVMSDQKAVNRARLIVGRLADKYYDKYFSHEKAESSRAT